MPAGTIHHRDLGDGASTIIGRAGKLDQPPIVAKRRSGADPDPDDDDGDGEGQRRHPMALSPILEEPAASAVLTETMLRAFVRDAVLAYGAKSAVRALPGVLRHGVRGLRSAVAGWDNARFGLFVGAYFLAFKLLERQLRQRACCRRWDSLVAGAVAAAACVRIAPGRQFRTCLGSYLLFRALHSLIRDGERRRRQLTLPSWIDSVITWLYEHGNAVSFCLGTGQLMYSFLMAPDALERSYVRWLHNVSYFDKYIPEATRNALVGAPVDMVRLAAVAQQPAVALVGGQMVPCECFHPGETHIERAVKLFLWNVRDVLPVYLGIYGVPKALQLLTSPLPALAASLTSSKGYSVWLAKSLRSSAFISAIIAAYQRAMGVGGREPLTYWLAGVVAALGILIEKPTRRTELALYVLPKAAGSLWHILKVPALPAADIVLFSASMAVIMHYYRKHGADLSNPLVHRILSKFL